MSPKGRFIKIYPGPYHPHQYQFDPIDLTNEEDENNAPRLTHLDEQSIPRYIRSDKMFLRSRHLLRLAIDEKIDTETECIEGNLLDQDYFVYNLDLFLMLLDILNNDEISYVSICFHHSLLFG